MPIVEPAIEDYLRKLYDDGDPVRREMEELARQRGFPIVGPLVGRELSLLVRATGARRIFELGSGFGYSALFFARAAGKDAVVHCTDLSVENEKSARDFLTRAGVWDQVTFHREEAVSALRRVGGTWDIIYNDIDKQGYPDTVDAAYEHLRPGGLFITDNVLWSGRVLDSSDTSASTRGVVEFTRRLFSHPGFYAAVNPTRDGVAVALRL
jgi:caffeoyl-CoA O-methyltransferase